MTSHSVLFVCLGNICRSPIGEAVFHDLITKKRLEDKWFVDSAGTGSHEVGSDIYGTAQTVLRSHGINYQHKARQVRKEDFEKFDLILGFDNDNMRNLERMKPQNCKAQVKLVNFFNEKNKNRIIPDPWYTDTIEAFELVYQDCLESCYGIFKVYNQ